MMKADLVRKGKSSSCAYMDAKVYPLADPEEGAEERKTMEKRRTCITRGGLGAFEERDSSEA